MKSENAQLQNDEEREGEIHSEGIMIFALLIRKTQGEIEWQKQREEKQRQHRKHRNAKGEIDEFDLAASREKERPERAERRKLEFAVIYGRRNKT